MNITKVLRQNNTNDPHLLGRGDIKKLLAQYSLPAIIGMVITSLYHIVDSIFIGHGIGASALSGMAVTFPIMNILAAFSTLIGVGGATLTSIRLGEKDEENARSILGHVALVNTVNGTLLGVVTLFFLEPVLKLFGASETLLPYASDFLSVYMIGIPVGFVFIGLNNIMRVTGYPKKAMLSSFLTVAVNVLLAPIFIFVLGWGMKGTALATVLSQLAGLVWVLMHFFNKNSLIRFEIKGFKLSGKTIVNMMAIGVSPFLMNLTSSLVVSIINFGLMKHGGDLAIGAYGIINRILFLFGMIVIGLTMGMQPIVGYNYGAKQIDRSFKALRYTIIVSVLIMTFGFLFSQLFPTLIMRMFTSDRELLDISVRGLRITTVLFPVIAVQMVISNFFQSVGKAKIAVFLSLTRQLIFLIPFLLLLPRYFGLDGVFMSMPAADLIAFFVTILTFTYQYKGMRVRK
ncbi:MAG TPA: MATE family efflux transporter [Porphyromonadaceae bacterium]|jgi:putative MATE family efflux protein|uniref:MATE family efflux transporter n=1 Tax=Petrimonas TaxID=307628 RepID=UPI000E8365D2|nr:MATE family efflux transporter [Petrimonas sp.]BBD46718.1 MATE efflux family protein [Petrimonas sp. IBARAKI]HAC73894.1 MATE family efflux transporter [Porphyromonadaceae bacterium]MDD4015880.1 MATE family efflux transporter [Petrimonas sp.]MDX9775185.1 MATE family efflux transporter [Petrimonas sp.]